MQEFCCFIVFLYQYIHSFIYSKVAGRGGATAPLATPLNPPLIQYIKGNVWKAKYSEKISLYTGNVVDATCTHQTYFTCIHDCHSHATMLVT